MISIAVNNNYDVNISQQELTGNICGVENGNESNNNSSFSQVTKKQWVVVIILFYVNLINYMDRYTIAAVLDDVKHHFNVNDKAAGFLQTVFIISYMCFAPIFGYLGDRYNRPLLMTFGVFLWSITTLMGSFMNTYYGFLVFRALVGIGEASYSTIAPTIISDLFVKDLRSKILAVFYLAIPVGVGLGYVVGSAASKLANSWVYSLRVTPILGIVAIVLVLVFIKDPERGNAEGGSNLEPTDWLTDFKEIINTKSFILSTLGFTCVAFVSGALGWHAANFISIGSLLISKSNVKSDPTIKFGIIVMLTGILGVSMGTWIAQKCRKRYPNADPLVCAFGLIIASPLFYFALVMNGISTTACFVFVFFGQLFLNLNWSIVADILLYVVAPTRRSFAESFQILVSHALGDAISPVFVGSISDALQDHFRQSNCWNSSIVNGYYNQQLMIEFKSMQYALFSTCFITVFGAAFFLWCAFYIVEDRKKVEIFTKSK